MKIIRKLIGEKSKYTASTKSWDVFFNDNSLIIELDNNRTLVIEGEVYYCRLPNGQIKIVRDKKSAIKLIKTLCSTDPSNTPNFIEGAYTAAAVDKKSDSVFVMGDVFGRVDIFYHEDNDNCIASTDVMDILSTIGEVKYQQEVLYCILATGYIPAKHTPYKKVRRLAYSERLLLEDGAKKVVQPELEEIKIQRMNDTDLKTYSSILESAILSRASDKENWVFISGGWDSTIMLATLCKHIDRRRIRPIVARLLLPDGKCYNPYEVSKAQRIASYYGLKCEVADAWLGGNETFNQISSLSKNLRSHMLFSWLHSFFAMAEVIKKKGMKGASVFDGAFSDALHNFGFAQFSSLPYLSYDFREYSDKMRCYMYSPSFLKKVLNSTYEKDFIFKLFWWHANSEQDVVKNKDGKDAVLNYLLSFIVSDFRIPFSRIDRENIFTKEGKEKFKKWLHDNYFKEAVEKINAENMYFYLIHLYKLFYLQSYEYRAVQSSFEGSGFHPRFPFLDMRLSEFLAQMPENWGRGLEWKPIKYPLKEYAKRNLDIPVEIIESEFHSYIDEKEDEERLIDWKSEMVNKSPLGLAWRNPKEQKIVGKIFDKEWFKNELIKKQLSRPCDSQTSKLVLNLVTFLTIGLEGA